MAIFGITVIGLTGMLTDTDGNSAVVTDPVYLSAEYIERGIATGTLKAGAFNRVHVRPPPDEWPEEWRFLKEKLANHGSHRLHYQDRSGRRTAGSASR